ncbi:MAG: CotH kinase family protein [Verrucomicrobiales bacterium]|nr:CotH kinase family protein [Verrucomicrobiales bacterium]
MSLLRTQCDRSAVGWVFLILLWMAATPRETSAQVVISELLAENHGGLIDEDGEHSDWIELFNAGSEAVDLFNWALTDKPEKKTKWVLPSIRLAPGRFLIVFASGKNRREPDRPLHTNFKLSKKGDYLGLIQPDGMTVASELTPAYPAQRIDISYGMPESFFVRPKPNAPPQPGYLALPTPGGPNRPGVGGSPPAPTFSQRSGLYSEAIQVSLHSLSTDVTIYFTTNGTLPDPTNGVAYRAALSLSVNTVLRARAYRPNSLPSDTATRSYLFIRDTLHQTGAGSPATWGVREGKPVPADYAMDPEVITNAAYAPRLEKALRSVPILSLTADPQDIFDPQRGIYSNPMETGAEWERHGAIEWIEPRGGPGFNTECGVRIQGGWNRRPEESPKHSLRLVFRKRHNAEDLKHPLFGEGVKEFEEIILRGGGNNSWLHWNSDERQRAEYLRDQWMRDTYREMGRLSARGRFVHLFLNGLYWGVYNLVERPGASFLAKHLGGKESQFDVRNADSIVEGDSQSWDELMKRVNDGVGTPEAYARVGELLDLPAFADYTLLNQYGANADYDRSSNWYVGRPRRPDGKFVFVVWDGERTLEKVGDSTLAYDDDQSPARIFQKLRENPEFVKLLARRAREICGDGGALSPQTSADRYKRLAASVEDALILESARWGDYRRDVHSYKTGPYELYTVDQHWKPEVQRLLNDYFPQRAGVFLKQLEEAALLPKP